MSRAKCASRTPSRGSLDTVVGVTQLNNGMWFVHWFSRLPASGTFQCGATKLRLTTGLSNDQVTLSLKEAQGNNSLTVSIIHLNCSPVIPV
jgi:hypothetical protein